ncbi:MAG: methylmalonyl Co-A mutase-associated GTPase MeaB [Synergistaceae bacterium]|nr:methylmalonyl Co-A mutase-associated GTPase MeaB [Synergistaceae bacterium]
MSLADAGTKSERRPEWVPEDVSEGERRAFTTRVMDGVDDAHDGMSSIPVPFTPAARTGSVPRRRDLSPDEYVDGVLRGDRTLLSRAITLVESNAAKHFELAQNVLQSILPYTGNSIRVGITGVPGAGKSTFIEALGTWLCRQGKKVAVLAVDPSSSLSRGSILGDKTRMENLAKEPGAFIRPSPSGGTLGGLTRKSRETLLLCEAAGYNIVLVETIGVGQSETTVRSMVDFFLLLVLTGAGDELQGMKKGVMELADAVLVNKADSGNMMKAEATRVEYERILHYLRPATEGWVTRSCACSALKNTGIEEIWNVVLEFVENVRASEIFDERRRQQTLSWVYGMVEEHLRKNFYDCPAVAANRRSVEERVIGGSLSATQAARRLLDLYEGGGRETE